MRLLATIRPETRDPERYQCPPGMQGGEGMTTEHTLPDGTTHHLELIGADQ